MRREGFGRWFAESGYLYVLVIALVGVAFLVRGLCRTVRFEDTADKAIRSEMARTAGE